MAKIIIKNQFQIAQMRAAGKVASEVLQQLAGNITVGMTTRDIDQQCKQLIKETGAKSAFYGYRGYPGQLCISVNEEVVHGIGGDRVINDGDVVSLDVGVTYKGWIGDNATTVPVGNVAATTLKLLAVTEQSLYEAIKHARAGVSLGDLCASVEAYVKPFGFGIVREFVGHGVGKNLHEEPQIPNYRPLGTQPRLRAGMILAIEPMVTEGRPAVKILPDNWTVITTDGKPSAHFEHTVLVTNDEPEILTDRPRIALPQQLGIEL